MLGLKLNHVGKRGPWRRLALYYVSICSSHTFLKQSDWQLWECICVCKCVTPNGHLTLPWHFYPRGLHYKFKMFALQSLSILFRYVHLYLSGNIFLVEIKRCLKLVAFRIQLMAFSSILLQGRLWYPYPLLHTEFPILSILMDWLSFKCWTWFAIHKLLYTEHTNPIGSRHKRV